jgi:hypothetical protein
MDRDTMSRSPCGIYNFKSLEIMTDLGRRLLNQMPTFKILLIRAPNLFTPFIALPLLWSSGRADVVSENDAAPLKSTLQRLVNFNRIEGTNVTSAPRCSPFPATEIEVTSTPIARDFGCAY